MNAVNNETLAKVIIEMVLRKLIAISFIGLNSAGFG
jgi:hypothetical protein